MRTNQNLYIITGGPGSGRTTTLRELEQLGFSYLPEVARQIIREQVREHGDALPWADRKRYTSLMLERSIASYRKHARAVHITFVDRGIPDTLAYAHLIHFADADKIRAACDRFRYARQVFIAPPWKEIYATDAERKQDFGEALRTYEVLIKTYQECNYELIELPLASPAERASFIINAIASSRIDSPDE
jgi:predicted ATPase